jgi:ABC-type spermidine/putrescine transport system permease subunit II
MSVRDSALTRAVSWIYLSAFLAVLYLPLLPPVLTSVSPGGRNPDLSGVTFRWYAELPANPVLTGSIATSIELALIVGLVTPPLALLGAMAVRELRMRRWLLRWLLLLLLLPLFVPGVSLGLASAFFFSQLGIQPSLWTVGVVNVMWALPFAFLIVLTAMSTFDPIYLEAAYVHGAGRLRAFLNVELPLIWPGVLGSATFSIIISFNETVRTALVQGPLNTVQTYIWSRFLQAGLTPPIYALMSVIVLLTLVLILGLLLGNLHRGRS